jgi:hypothetical protein
MPGFTVQIHSDNRDKGIIWCKQNLEQKSWKCIKYTDVYESTFCFEHKKDAENFDIAVGY